MIRKVVFEEDEGWCWEIETPNRQKMWVGDDFMKALMNHPEVKEAYEKMEESK